MPGPYNSWPARWKLVSTPSLKSAAVIAGVDPLVSPALDDATVSHSAADGVPFSSGPVLDIANDARVVNVNQ
jgi:hypothetical protein